MKSPHIPHRFLLASAAAMAYAVCSQADTYTLGGEANESNVGSSSSPVSWSDTANWTPSALPGSGDSIQWAPSKTGSHRHAYISLDGDYTVGSLSQNYRTLHLYKDANTVAETVSLTFATQLGADGYQQGHELTSGVKLVVPAGATFTCSAGDHNWTGMDIKSGAEADIYGAILSRVMKLEVNGGTLVFAPASYAVHGWGRTQTDHDEINIAGGSASFPNGIAMTGTYTEPNQVNQSGGTATFGGDFTSQMAWTYTWSGGTLAITDDSTFGANVALVIPASSAVSLDIASGKTFAAPGLSADSTASITVTGGGTFSIAPTTAPILLQNGSLGLATSATYDLSNVSLGAGASATITLTAFGATVNALPAALAGATFAADLSGAAAGTVILNSSDPSVLAKVKSDLDASTPAGMSLAISGTSLSLEAQSAYAFTITGDLLGTTGWGGAVPPAGEEVSIEGSGVVATYTSGAVPAWTSITVKDGATLRVAGDATLPPVILNKSATLEIDNNATLTLANAGDLSGIATASQVPVLSVASGATLNVPGGMKFSNVSIALAGTIAATTPGGLTFGYAAAGETTYIGLASNGGTISIEPGSGDYNTSPLAFCCPAAGGTVNAIGSLVLTSTTLLPNYTRGEVFPLTVAYQIGFYVGVNNPANVPFEVVFDNTQWGVLGSFFVKGGATFRLANGGAYKNFESVGYWGRYSQIAENGRIVVGSGSEFRMNALGDYGSNPLEVVPTSSGHQAIVVEDGGVFETYRFSGNGNGVFVASNSVYTIYMPFLYNEHYSQSSGTTTIYDTTNIPFAGFQSVALGNDSTLTFSTRNKVFWDSGQFDNESGGRVVALANVPITGGGSILVSNANANVFGIVVQSGANTATGTAGVVLPTAANIGATTLYFADGANWAGTVIATNDLVRLVKDFASATNAAASPTPVEVSFGGIEMQDDFALRLWQNGTCDTINIGANGWTGSGKLDFEFVDFASPGAQAWKVATQPEGTALPAVKKASFSLYTQASATEGVVDVFLKVANGTAILLR